MEIDEALKYDVIAMPKDSEESVSYALKGMGAGEESVSFVKAPELENNQMDNDRNCVLCEFILSKIESELHNETNRKNIENVVENICNVMPKTVRQRCEQFMQQYVTRILELMSTMPPKVVCSAMQLCSNNNELDLPAANDGGLRIQRSDILQKTSAEVIECGVCYGVTSSLQPYFYQMKKEQQHNLDTFADDGNSISITEMIDIACENLPAKYYVMVSVSESNYPKIAITN